MTLGLVILYFVITIGLAVFLEMRSRRKAQTSESFSTGRNTMGVIAVFGLMVGNVLGGGYVIGTPGGVAATNLGYNWTAIGYIIGWTFTIWFLKYYRAAGFHYGASSLGEVFRHYWSARCQKIVSIMIFLAFAGSLSSSMNAVSSIFRAILPIDFAPSIVLTIVIITVLALLGGMGGLARINVVHVFVLALSVIIIAIMCAASVTGGFSAAWAKFAAEGHASFAANPLTTAVTVIVNPFVCCVSALSIAGTIGAKNLRTAKKAQIGLPIFAIIFFGCLSIVGVCGVQWGLAGDNTLWSVAAAKLGEVPSALASIGVLAATLSSAPAMILMMASVLMREFIDPDKGDGKSKFTEKKKIFYTRVCIVICSVLFQILGIFSTDLIRIISNAYSVWGVCGLALFISLIWKKPNELAMFWSMIIGTILCAIWIFAGFFVEGGMLLGLPTQLIALVSTVVILVIVTLATAKEKRSENYNRWLEAKAALEEAQKQGIEGA